MDQITNPQLEFDLLLKMDIFRAVLYGGAGRLDKAFDCLEEGHRQPATQQAFCEPRVTTHTVPLRHDNIGN